MNITKRICAQMRAVPVTTPQCAITVTVSIGVTVCPVGNAKAVNELIDEADVALYQAKNSGRNQAILAQAVK